VSTPHALALVALSSAVLLAIMAGVKLVGMHFGWRPELQRKAVHIATGSYATCLPLIFSDRWPVLLLIGIAAATMLILRLPRLATSGLGTTLHGVERKSYGELLLAAPSPSRSASRSATPCCTCCRWPFSLWLMPPLP
jgi:phytol kinase